MTGGMFHVFSRVAVAASLAYTSLSADAQVAAADGPAEKSALASGIERTLATEPISQIRYLRLVMRGRSVSAADGERGVTPTIFAQCSQRPNGKFYFDLFTRFEGEPDLTLYPPWKPSGPNDFPPRTQKVTIIMDFLGYAHVKPARKQWEIPVETPGQYRYNQPGFGSSNMEDVSYYLQYLIALPTLRLTLDRQSSEFNTAPLLDQIRKEPMCVAAHLK